MSNGLDAKHLGPAARKACRALHFTPRRFEVLTADRPAMASGPDDPEYPVLRVWNARREVTLTNHELAYAHEYLD